MAVLSLVASTARADEPVPIAPAVTNAPSKFRSAEDGWPDASGFLDEKYGFLPVVIPITEAAVGYGAAGGLALDVAFGPDNTAVYIQVGSAWARP
jgi:hypothetical protein